MFFLHMVYQPWNPLHKLGRIITHLDVYETKNGLLYEASFDDGSTAQYQDYERSPIAEFPPPMPHLAPRWVHYARKNITNVVIKDYEVHGTFRRKVHDPLDDYPARPIKTKIYVKSWEEAQREYENQRKYSKKDKAFF